MANYHEYSVLEVTDVEKVGMGSGDNGGELRICIGLEGQEINGSLHPDWKKVNWISMTEECAKHLYELLEMRFGKRQEDTMIATSHKVYMCPLCGHKNYRPGNYAKVNCDRCCKTFDTEITPKTEHVIPDNVCGSCVHREACKVILGADYDDTKACDRTPGRWKKG